MLIKDAEGCIHFDAIDDDEFARAAEHFEKCIDAWDGDPLILLSVAVTLMAHLAADEREAVH
jgi:hypothetical protein